MPPTQTTTDFNISVQIGSGVNAKSVTISAGDFADISTKGLHFALPDDKPVTIGTLKDFIDWVNTTFSVDLPDKTDGADIPGPLKDILDGLLNVSTTVSKFTVDQDPKGTDNTYPDPTFSLAVTGTAMDPKDPTKPKPISFAGVFSITGGGVGVTRTNETTT
jgi:hypothetical protein